MRKRKKDVILKKFTIVTVSVKLIRIPGKRVIFLTIKTLLISTFFSVLVEIKLIFFHGIFDNRLENKNSC